MYGGVDDPLQPGVARHQRHLLEGAALSQRSTGRLHALDGCPRLGQLRRHRALGPNVLDKLLTGPRPPLLPPVAQHPYICLGKERLRSRGEEQATRDRQLAVLRQATSVEQEDRIGRAPCPGVTVEKGLVNQVQGGDERSRLIAGLSLVVEQLSALREAEPAVLVANAQEDLILAVGVERVAVLDLDG